MSVHDKYKHWTQAGTLSTLSKFQIDELRKNHSVEIYHRRVMIRRKPSKQLTLVQPTKKHVRVVDFARQDYNRKENKVNRWFQRLIRRVMYVIITFELFIGYLMFYTKPPVYFEYKQDISPVTFTEQELKDFYAKYSSPTPAYAETSVEATIRKYFGAEADTAIACAKAESGLRPRALNTRNKNGTWDSGLFQINSIHCGKLGLKGDECKEKLFDIETNIKMAKSIHEDRGWNAWYACKQFWSK